MKTIISVLFFALLASTSFSQKKSFESIELKKGSTPTKSLIAAATPQCIYAKDITAHYCGPRLGQFFTPNPIYVSNIVLGINEQTKRIPGSACSNQGSQKDWTHFDVETVIVLNYYGNELVIPSTKIAARRFSVNSDTYNFAGSPLSFFNLPSNMVGKVSPSFPNNKNFSLRVTITGVNGTVRSNYSTTYDLEVTRDIGAACTTPSAPTGPMKK